MGATTVKGRQGGRQGGPLAFDGFPNRLSLLAWATFARVCPEHSDQSGCCSAARDAAPDVTENRQLFFWPIWPLAANTFVGPGLRICALGALGGALVLVPARLWPPLRADMGYKSRGSLKTGNGAELF